MEPFSIDPAVRFAVFDGELKPEEIYVPHKSTAAKVKVPHIVLSEEEAVSQGWHFKKKSRSRIRLTKYTGSESDVVIPSQIGEYTVNELKKRLFYEKQIDSVQIPDTVRKIGEECFRASTVQRIVVAAPVTEIPYTFAFGCEQLREVILPDTVSVIGADAFGGCCYSLTEIRFPDSLREIGAHAFSRSALSSFTMTHGERIRAHGTAFDETPLCYSYRMIASSYSKKDGYRIMQISHKNRSVILPAEHFYFGRHAIYNKGAVGVKTLDCSACTHVSFDYEAVQCNHSFAFGEPSHIPLTIILPKKRTGSVYFENCIHVRYNDGTEWEGVFLPVSRQNGVTEYRLKLPALLSYSCTLTDEKVRLSGMNAWLDFEPNAVCSRTMSEITFGELRGRDRLFHRGCENLHHVIWKQKCGTEGKTALKSFEVYLPSGKLIGSYAHDEFLSAFFGRYIQCNDTWALFDSGKYDRVFMRPLPQKEKIVIAVDVLRSTPSLFPKRKMYDTYLRNHLRYALIISASLPDDYAVFLKVYAQNQARL